MLNYYRQLEEGADDVQHVIGIGRDKNANRAYSQAEHRASVELAAQKGIHVESRTNTRLSTTSDNSTEVDNIAQVAQTINSMSPVVSLCRTHEDGTTEINLYYIIKY